MPGKGSKIEFCDGQNKFKVPFIMYTDFELILEPIQGPNPAPTGSSVEHGTFGPYTSEVTKHSPSGWCVYTKFAYGEVKDPLKLYRGKNCLEKFCDYIRQEAHRLHHMFSEKPMDPLTKSNGSNMMKRIGIISVLNHLLIPKRAPKSAIIAIIQAVTEGPHIRIAI